MRRKLLLAVAFVVTLAIAMFASAHVIDAREHATYTATYSLNAGGLDRSYEVIVPVPLPRSAPVIIVLSGIHAPVSNEISRDRLVPYADAGEAELVYPVGYDKSWNAGGCCGEAAALNVDDVAFIRALSAAVDPGHAHPLIIVGYSNGGRLAYRLGCDSPGMFDLTVIVKAMPEPDCDLGKPLTILQVDSLDDTFVPYQPGDKGSESPPATVQSARLRSLDGCTGAGAASRYGGMTLTTWTGCTSGQRYGFAVWDSGGHGFPRPEGATPGTGQIIMSFLTKTPVAPPPG
jgi:polyhydroxybutyrate depolymerase